MTIKQKPELTIDEWFDEFDSLRDCCPDECDWYDACVPPRPWGAATPIGRAVVSFGLALLLMVAVGGALRVAPVRAHLRQYAHFVLADG